jgi:taurine--2-oxoglutarate transaminase
VNAHPRSPGGGYPFFFTWKAQKHAHPLRIKGGEGSYFETEEGERWLDLGSLIYQANLGHGHPRMVEAIKRQADRLCLSIPQSVFPEKIELAEKLLARAPAGFSKVFFTLGGSDAVENAIKIARMVTGRQKLISRYRSYHGATFGALSLTGDWRRPPLEPGIPGVIHALDCYCDRCPFGQTLDRCHRECATHIGDLLELEGSDRVAAVVLEPVPGASGVLVPPPDYWPIIREACDRHGTLLIADEVLTGFGRTGRWFAVEHFGVVPDMITIGKALTGGYGTLGAVLVHDRVAQYFDDNMLYAGLTGYAHPLGCAAALEAINIYSDDRLVERAAELEPQFMSGLAGLRELLTSKRAFVRGMGLLGILEIDGATPDEWNGLQQAVDARKVHLHIRPRIGGVILAPPLVVTRDELDTGFALLGEALIEAMNP